ncbi:MAG: hypothetical protein H6953_15140 [Chromatiaceae bacterium]|nr:hypothetical protein [Chromatiaceae bacterium]MCP5421721.1 hypothetical protein [Chromatiaceae bacterium]
MAIQFSANHSSAVALVMVAITIAAFVAYAFHYAEVAVEITESGIVKEYWSKRTQFLPFKKITRGLFDYPFRGKVPIWRVCFEYNNCQPIGNNIFFGAAQRRALNAAVFEALKKNGIFTTGYDRT